LFLCKTNFKFQFYSKHDDKSIVFTGLLICGSLTSTHNFSWCSKLIIN